CFQDIQLPPTF
nr:immunoglobulin light chain junction region [Macaca mulatta]MOX97447.1 immunoglobulin light chain junction region [Macaca mulatta]MOX97528.1 immunoglobulin light chain junction region [Macaca mulatta]MOX97641.1 immunoglobulin light chain junction region [Macaca mulatta]MOX97692.1 immunoglobulin light chain junction region [Macaca mulatta]